MKTNPAASSNSNSLPLQKAAPVFTPYQKWVIAILALLQFTIILDFMILAPLGALLMDQLKITTGQFGWVVSAYAFSAGAAGILAAGFADKFDRKKLILVFYGGFILGTILCGIAPTYHFLLAARIVTGIFGGVLGSVIFAVIADLFPMEKRGRVMGFVQSAFAGAQVMGIPLGLLLSNKFGWHAPFLMVVAFGGLIAILIISKLKPIDEHLKIKSDQNPLDHLFKTLSRGRYLGGFAATIFLATGGFMLMPFSSAYSVHNLGISLEKLPLVYLVTGIFSMVAGPLLGKLSDKIGKFALFLMGTVLMAILVTYYCSLGITPLWQVIVINIILFIGISARMISAQALTSAVPEMKDRGAYMSISSAVAQFSGGLAAYLAGSIVVQNADGSLGKYNILGYVVVAAMMAALALMYNINNIVKAKK